LWSTPPGAMELSDTTASKSSASEPSSTPLKVISVSGRFTDSM
jgi:hypothetical protein